MLLVPALDHIMLYSVYTLNNYFHRGIQGVGAYTPSPGESHSKLNCLCHLVEVPTRMLEIKLKLL